MLDIWAIITVIVIAGLAGGYAGYLQSLLPDTPPAPSPGKNNGGNTDINDPSETPTTPKPNLQADLFIGVVASACVPALLRLTNSDFAKELFYDIPLNAAANACKNNCAPINHNTSLLYLAGLCLVAAYTARTFLNNFATKFMAQKVAQLQASVNRIEKKLSGPST